MTVSLPTRDEVLRKQAWDAAVNAFGTAKLFERRQRRLRLWLRLLAFVGIAFPVAVGGTVIAYGISAKSLPYVLGVGGALGILQLVVSVWALVAQWDARLAHASESVVANHSLAVRFRAFAENPPQSGDLEHEFALLSTENEQREQNDYKQDLSDKEIRLAHRAGLRQFQRECVACHQVPLSMTPTKCDVCGNF